MLSGESANGLYPVKAVTMLRKLAEEAGEGVSIHACPYSMLERVELLH